MSETELGVVCKSCGSEVSPYVTECPYCGARIRKRAPKLERHGDEITAKQRRRARSSSTGPRLRMPSLAADRPYATIAAIMGSAVIVLVQRALDKPLADLGAIVGPVGSEWWRYLSAPFVYNDLGYLFIVGVTVAVFGSAVERRLGTPPTVILIAACGALGMLAADGIESVIKTQDILLAAGGNGIALGVLAAWLGLEWREGRRYSEFDLDLVGITVFAVVLLALPIVDDFANLWAGMAGAGVGGLAGLAAAGLGRARA